MFPFQAGRTVKVDVLPICRSALAIQCASTQASPSLRYGALLIIYSVPSARISTMLNMEASFALPW
jgi:hypothetical protein